MSFSRAVLSALLLWSLVTPPAAANLPVLPADTTVPHRLSGKAPLFVNFDLTGTVCSGTCQVSNPTRALRPFHDFTYTFDCGDGNTDTYSLAGHKIVGRCKFSGGPRWAVVYETPGVYLASWSASGPDGTVSGSTNITVTAWDTDGDDSMCFAPAGQFAGCPTNAVQTVTSNNFNTDMATCVATKSACFFLTGLILTADTRTSFNKSTYVDCFNSNGVGWKAGSPAGIHDNNFIVRETFGGQRWLTFNAAGSDTRFRCMTSDTEMASNVWLEFQSADNANVSNILLQGMNIPATGGVPQAYDGNMNSHSNGFGQTVPNELPKHIGIFDSSVEKCRFRIGTQCAMLAVDYLAFVNSVVDSNQAGGGNVFRTQHCAWCLLYASRIGRTSSNAELTMRGLDLTGLDSGFLNLKAQFNQISDVWLDSGTSATSFDLGGRSQGDPWTSQHENYLIERVYFSTPAGGSTPVSIAAIGAGGDDTDLTVRNSIFNFVNEAPNAVAVSSIWPDTVYENLSVYAEDATQALLKSGGWLRLVNAVTFGTSNSLKGQTGTFTADVYDGTQLSVSPYTTTPPREGFPQDFQLTSPNATLIDTGTAIVHDCDFTLRNRVVGAAIDVGASEYNPGDEKDACDGGGAGPPPEPPMAPESTEGILPVLVLKR